MNNKLKQGFILAHLQEYNCSAKILVNSLGETYFPISWNCSLPKNQQALTALAQTYSAEKINFLKFTKDAPIGKALLFLLLIGGSAYLVSAWEKIFSYINRKTHASIRIYHETEAEINDTVLTELKHVPPRCRDMITFGLMKRPVTNSENGLTLDINTYILNRNILKNRGGFMVRFKPGTVFRENRSRAEEIQQLLARERAALKKRGGISAKSK